MLVVFLRNEGTVLAVADVVGNMTYNSPSALATPLVI